MDQASKDQAPIVDRGLLYPSREGLNTFGDMYSYSRKELARTLSYQHLKVHLMFPDIEGIYDMMLGTISRI